MKRKVVEKLWWKTLLVRVRRTTDFYKLPCGEADLL